VTLVMLKFAPQEQMLEENVPQMAVNVVVQRMVVVRLASWLPAPHPVHLLLKLLHQAVASLQMHLVQSVVMAMSAAQL
jgi:hypothetical protein